MNLAKHPFFEATDPAKMRLVRRSPPFPYPLNPFAADGVVIRAAAIPGEFDHSKDYMARELVLAGILEGKITRETLVKFASSGNTAHGGAKVCKAIEVSCEITIPAGVPIGKLEAIRIMGSGIEFRTHSNPDETYVQRVRREAALQENCFDTDQYANPNNPLAHKKYLAPQLFESVEETALVGVASGTMGTAIGLKQHVIEHGLPAEILPAVVVEDDEVPGARTLPKIEKDVLQPWKKFFSKSDLEFGTKKVSLLLAFYSWRCVPKALGPSFGLAYQATLRRLYKEKQNDYRGLHRKKDGTIEVLILGADSNVFYLEMFAGETKEHMRHAREVPDLLALAL